MEKKFKEIIARSCDVKAEDMSEGMRFREDLGFSSLDFMSFLGELEDNFDYYLDLSSKEDVCIERNGLKIALLTNPESYASLKKNYSNE